MRRGVSAVRTGVIAGGTVLIAAGLAAPLLIPSAGASVAMVDVGPRSVVDDTVLGTFEALGAGVTGSVRALAVSRDDTVYAGGFFTNAGGNPNADYIAAWSNADDTWHALGTGVGGTAVRALSADDTLYVGGTFTTAGGVSNTFNLAAWSTVTRTWSAIGTGVNNEVYALAVQGDDTVYAGGAFTSDPSGGPLNGSLRIAAWSYADDTWHALGTGVGAAVEALAVQGDDTVYAGGAFTDAGGKPAADHVAAWSYADDTWHALGAGVTNWVYALALQGDDTVYVGGSFEDVSGNPGADGVVAWSNADDTWHALGSGITHGNYVYVYDVAVDDTRGLVYAGGDFITAGDDSASRVAVWDVGLGEWIALQAAAGQGVSSDVHSLALDDSVLYLGGDFTNAGGVAVNRVARWTWDAPTAVAVPASGAAGASILLEGSGLIGVTGVRVDGSPVSYTRDDSTTISLTLPGGLSSGTHSITVDAVGGRAATSYAVPAPLSPVVYPPGAPTSALAAAGDRSALVSWVAPMSAGSFPVSNYQVTAAPGGKSCLVSAPTLMCEVTGLANGTSYTFTVRALNGAGWGASSGPSNAVTPSSPAVKSIVITGSRDASDTRVVRVSGTATGLVGEQVMPWIRFPGEASYSAGSGTRTVGTDGSFEWSRKSGKRISVYFTHDMVKSNTVVIPAR